MAYDKIRVVAKGFGESPATYACTSLQKARETFDRLGRSGLLYKEIQGLRSDSIEAGFNDAWETLESFRFVREIEE